MSREWDRAFSLIFILHHEIHKTIFGNIFFHKYRNSGIMCVRKGSSNDSS